ncbi:MAG: hypothetical protein U9Q80_10320 [Bacillota bacterium]|nr:hypothetical protein [Bacillota bacterium]
MGIFLTVFIALAIGLYVFSIIRKSGKNIKAGKCVSCNGHCSDSTCEFHD